MVNLDPSVTLAALLTLMIWSVLYKHNILYRIVEHTMIGCMAGYGVGYYLNSLNSQAIKPIMNQGNWVMAIGLGLGLLMYMRFSKGYSHLIRWPLAAMAGIAAGAATRGTVKGYIMGQIQATVTCMFVAGNNIQTLNNVLIFVCIIASLCYFIFSI
jgi:hypothetical protein